MAYEVPFWVLVIMMIVIPGAVTAAIGVLAFRRTPRLTFCCRRCNGVFRGKAQRPFPRTCPLCGSPDWTSPAA